ncbi:MAG: ATP-binding protein [Leptospiraceae bacterium]|nr:ATP-binding protein [Leptospiraceae bacterium]
MKKLPIGIQTFAKIRDPEDEHYYVDKTEILKRLVSSGSYFFLSRPRRFGKSLFLDTLKEVFEGNRELFNGLYLENNWDFSKKHPVVKIDFGTAVIKSPDNLREIIQDKLNRIALAESIVFKSYSLSEMFKDLIQSLESKYSEKVVILIDEYDKPILDNITETETARLMRDELCNLYSVIKGSDAHLKFVFITGVSKFSKVNLYSGLNNLQDITLDERFATICGYTEKDLQIFEDHMEGVDREELKLWYNGYNFLGDKVYNPFDILLYLDRKDFKNYWCETGNPTFLIDLIKKNQYNVIGIEQVRITEEQMGSFDVDSIELEVLLFQTGYLTIVKRERIVEEIYYTLKYPNLEVKKNLTAVILYSLSGMGTKINPIRISVYEKLKSSDFDGLKSVFHSFFASILHDWYRKNTLANYEAYYASIFYCYFAALGLDVRAEDVTNHGQVDMTVFFENRVFVFEFKVIELTESGSALSQIKQKRYYEKYLGLDRNGDPITVAGTSHAVSQLRNSIPEREIYLIGVEFSREDRNITNFEWEKV